MMRISQLACSLGVFFYASVAHADLMPPGGEGVSECRNKKAGDACERMFIDDGGWRREPGTCVKENLDHLPLKFKAHLRCVAAPSASASAAAPPASVVPTAPVVSSAVVAPKAPAPAPSVAADTPKSSGGCSFAHEPAKGAAFAFVVLALGLLLRKRERVRY